MGQKEAQEQKPRGESFLGMFGSQQEGQRGRSALRMKGWQGMEMSWEPEFGQCRTFVDHTRSSILLYVTLNAFEGL